MINTASQSFPGHVPKVSVLIPTYNYAGFLDETIQSVLNQTYGDFELIIVDNHSQDNTKEVVSKYLSDSRVSFYENEVNLGLSGNWNQCLKFARGEYIKFLCADDKFDPLLLERFVPIMDANEKLSLITCFRKEFGKESGVYEPPATHIQPGNKIVFATVKYYNWIGEPSAVMFRRKDLKVGNFGNYIWVTDLDMWIRLLAVGDCYIVPETRCFIRTHEQQMTKHVIKNSINILEEYHLLKALQSNTYAIDLSAYTEEINELVKRKATFCAKIIPSLLMTVWRKNALKNLLISLGIIYREQVITTSMRMVLRKILNRKVIAPS